MRDQQILLKPREAGRLIGFSERKVYYLVREGKLPAFWLDAEHKALMRIRRVDVDAYVAALPKAEV
jgi:excisionase family DNA binding protein